MTFEPDVDRGSWHRAVATPCKSDEERGGGAVIEPGPAKTIRSPNRSHRNASKSRIPGKTPVAWSARGTKVVRSSGQRT